MKGIELYPEREGKASPGERRTGKAGWLDTSMVRSNNSTLNRLQTIAETMSFAILTAWREGFSKNENEKRNASLMEMLRSRGLGPIRVRGIYRGGDENSFMVPRYRLDDAEFFSLVAGMARKYGQESFIFRFEHDASPRIYFPDYSSGEETRMLKVESLGRFTTLGVDGDSTQLGRARRGDGDGLSNVPRRFRFTDSYEGY